MEACPSPACSIPRPGRVLGYVTLRRARCAARRVQQMRSWSSRSRSCRRVGEMEDGLAWLDLRLAALPDTLFKFLLVSNQPQPGSRSNAHALHLGCHIPPTHPFPSQRAATSSCSLWLCRQTADCFQFVAQSAVQSICQRHHECQGLVPTHSRFWGWALATVPAPAPAPVPVPAVYAPFARFIFAQPWAAYPPVKL